MSLAKLLSRDNPVLAAYVFYGAVLVLKMLAMSLLTARQRFRNKVFANPEDAVGLKGKVKFDNPDVERVRRAHLNDLENIPAFLVAGWLYVLTGPSPALAVNLFRVFTAARVLHTLVYAVVIVPQPARALVFGVGTLVTGYMAVHSALYFL